MTRGLLVLLALFWTLLLGVPAGSPCLVIERRTWRSGQAITSVRLAYPGAAHSVAARFTPSR